MSGFQDRLKQRLGGSFQDRLKQRVASSAPVGTDSSQLATAAAERWEPAVGVRQHAPNLEPGALEQHLTTANDAVLAGQNAALLDWGAELTADPTVTRRALDLGRARSPRATGAAEGVGTAFSALATAPAPLLGGVAQGYLTAAGAQDADDPMDALASGEALQGAGVGLLLGGAAKGVSGVGRALRGAPKGLPNLVREATEPAQSWWPGIADARGFAVDLAQGNFPAAGKSGALYLARRVPGVRDSLARGGEAVASSPATAAVGRGLASVGSVVPRAAETGYAAGLVSHHAGQEIGDADSPAIAEKAVGGAQANELPSAALDAIHAGGDALGRWKAEFFQAAASPDQDAVGALLSRLTESDAEFRQTVLPKLSAMTAGGE